MTVMKKMNLFYEWMTGTLSRSVCTFNLNRAVQSIKLHQCRYLPFIGLIITQRLRNKRRLSNEYTLSWLTSCMFRRKRTRADPPLVDSLTFSFGCSFVYSFIRSVCQYIIHVFIHSCCMHRRKLARADPSLVDSIARLFLRSFVRSFIHPFINSVSQSVSISFTYSFVYFFVRSFIHPFIYSVSQSVHLANIAFFLTPRTQKFNCVAALPQLKSYLL